MRAVSHTLVLVLCFPRHIDIAPARTGGQDDAACLKHTAILHMHFSESAGFGSGNQLRGTLQVHDVDLIVAHLGFKCCREFGAIGLQHGDVVFDRHGVVHLTAKAFSCNADPDAFAGCVNGRCRTGGAATHDQHIEGILVIQFGGLPCTGVTVDFADNLFQRHATRTEQSIVHEDHRDRHDLTRVHFCLVQGAVNHNRLNFRVVDGHERGRLHHVGTVVAGQRHVDLEVHLGIQSPDLLKDFQAHLGRVTTRPQQCQDQRSEFVTERYRCKAHTACFALLGDHEGGSAPVAAGFIEAYLV